MHVSVFYLQRNVWTRMVVYILLTTRTEPHNGRILGRKGKNTLMYSGHVFIHFPYLSRMVILTVHCIYTFHCVLQHHARGPAAGGMGDALYE